MTYKAEKIVPYHSQERKTVQVEHMFDDISTNYDVLNHTLSMGIDYSWRRKGILALKNINPQLILDIATGTGDLAIRACELLEPKQITGIDISEGMMRIGKEKVSQKGLTNKILFEKQDCANLTFHDNSFDAAMVAFGIRNFENLDKALQEIVRVLKPSGKLMILELSTPVFFPMKQLYTLYSKIIIPGIGRLISKNKAAYRYLPKTVAAFPQGAEMVKILQKNGFANAICKRYTMGICSMYLAQKGA